MHIDLESSLSVPKDRPLDLKLAPTSLTITASGKPRVSLGPFEVQLPELQVDLPGFDIVLPEPKFEGTLYTIIPYVEYPFPGLAESVAYIAGGQDAADDADLIPAVGPTIDESMTRKMPAARNPDGSAHGPDGLRLNGMGVGLGFEARAKLGTLQFVPTAPLKLTWNKTLAVHGVPIDEKNGPVPMYVELDLDHNRQPLQIKAATSEIDLSFRGTIELDGIKKK